MSKKLIVAIGDHDIEQLQMLAAMKKIKMSELVRAIIKAYLDGRKGP